MDTHKNARLTPKGREEMVRAVVDRGMSKAVAAAGVGIVRVEIDKAGKITIIAATGTELDKGAAGNNEWDTVLRHDKN